MQVGDEKYFIKDGVIIKGKVQMYTPEETIPATAEFENDGGTILESNTGTYEELEAKLDTSLKEEKANAEAEVTAKQAEIDALEAQKEEDVTDLTQQGE